MLTIFSCPKPFTDPHINIIQRNAIKSWTLLKPKPEIILIGDEEGTAEICKEFGLHHIPEVERSEYGTPLVSSLFNLGQANATNDIVCYVNADIILMRCFIKALTRIMEGIRNKEFLMVGRRWDVDIKEYIDYGSNWEKTLKEIVKKTGKRQTPGFIDYFVFPKGFYDDIPPFALGRSAWDNWLIYYAFKKRADIIDTTPINIVIHQNHGYPHIPQPFMSLYQNYEFRENAHLLGSISHIYTLRDATFILTPEGIKKTPSFRRYIAIADRYIYGNFVRLVRNSYPLTLPVLIIGKSLRWWYRQIIIKARRLLYE